VARNIVRNAERSRRRRERLAAKAASAAPATATSSPERDPEVLAALGRLRATDREILRLHAWEDLGPSEIATVLNISAGAAKVRLHRARRRLAAELDQKDPR
ncbi:MAG: sigma-70 family RNA polymerase sigma factor, partial [Acidimicrobiia bacterium]|nr:sigma-70 family RNA polymerase sigma factor [Acidimicrobiia bacterium]